MIGPMYINNNHQFKIQELIEDPSVRNVSNVRIIIFYVLRIIDIFRTEGSKIDSRKNSLKMNACIEE